MYRDLGLSNLVNISDWQKIQDSFSEALEITLRTISLDGEMLTKTSRPSRLCSEILPSLPNANAVCGGCFSKTIKQSFDIKTATNFKCPFGLDVFVVPITAVGNRVVAYIVIGPLILKARKDRQEYSRYAEGAGIALDVLLDALIEINVFSYNKVYSIMTLVREIFSHMAQTGYHKIRLGEIAPKVVEMDPVFSRYYEGKILTALLHSCALALNADSGSVMTLDKGTNMLHIKVASKLDDNIVNNTNIRVGEGIAGVAAATAKPIILPKDKHKNHLSDKMKRSYIKSSMIVPFNKGGDHDVYGVINLNMVRKNVDFSDKDIELVRELVNMASIALTPLHQEEPSTQ